MYWGDEPRALHYTRFCVRTRAVALCCYRNISVAYYRIHDNIFITRDTIITLLLLAQLIIRDIIVSLLRLKPQKRSLLLLAQQQQNLEFGLYNCLINGGHLVYNRAPYNTLIIPHYKYSVKNLIIGGPINNFILVWYSYYHSIKGLYNCLLLLAQQQQNLEPYIIQDFVWELERSLIIGLYYSLHNNIGAI